MPDNGVWIGLGILAVLVVLYLLFRSIVRIIPDYKRLGVYRGGVFVGDKGPGIYLTLPLLDRVRSVDIRTREVKIEHSEFLTRDGRGVSVTILCFYQIENTYAYLNRIYDFEGAFRDLLAASLAMVIASREAGSILPELQQIRQEVYDHVQSIVDPWGARLQTLEFMDIHFHRE